MIEFAQGLQIQIHREQNYQAINMALDNLYFALINGTALVFQDHVDLESEYV